MTFPVPHWASSCDPWAWSHPSLLDAVHAEDALGKTNKQTFLLTNVISDLNAYLFFFSLDEESIGRHLLTKLMWCRAIRRHSNQIKLPGPETVQTLLCLRAFARAFLPIQGVPRFPHIAHLHLADSYSFFRPHIFRDLFCDSTHDPRLICALVIRLYTFNIVLSQHATQF